jgi:hypothetical protein
LKVAGRLVFATEADAKDGETAVDMGRIIAREMTTLTPARRKASPLIATALEPLRVAFKGATVKRDGKVVTANMEAKPDLANVLKAGARYFLLEPTRPPSKGPRPRIDEKK